MRFWGTTLVWLSPAVPEVVKRPVGWLGYGSGPKGALVPSQVSQFAGLRNERSDVVEVPLIITAAREVPFCYPFTRSSELEDTLSRGNRKQLFPVVDV